MRQKSINKVIRKHLKEDGYTQVHPKNRNLQRYEDFGFSFWAKIWDEEDIQILVQDEKGNSEDYYLNYRKFLNNYKYKY